MADLPCNPTRQQFLLLKEIASHPAMTNDFVKQEQSQNECLELCRAKKLSNVIQRFR